jgi:hypothetical protein
VPEFLDMLRAGLDRAYDAALVRPTPAERGVNRRVQI